MQLALEWPSIWPFFGVKKLKLYLTGNLVLAAAKAVAIANGIDRDSFPPKPPPIRLTFATILFIGTFKQWATNLWVSVGFWVDEYTVISPSSLLGTEKKNNNNKLILLKTLDDLFFHIFIYQVQKMNFR